MRSFPRTWAPCLLVPLLAAAAGAAVRLDTFASRVHEFTLANGLRVVLLEDHGAPVVTACFTARGGYADDPKGMRGMATLASTILEEGPELLGSRNPAEERTAFKTLAAAIASYRALVNKPGAGGELDRMDAEAKVRMAAGRADALAKARFSARVMEQYGADDFSVSVNADQIQWSARLPSHRIDAFLLLYGEWLKKPVARMVYSNRERLVREHGDTPPSQDSILRNTLLRAAFGPQSYGVPPVEGAELPNLHLADVESFLQARFAASNLTLALSGDLTLAEAQSLAARYLDKIPAGQPAAIPPPPPFGAKEARLAPPGEMTGLLTVAYRRPPEASPDDPVFDLISEILIDSPANRLRGSFAKAHPLLANPSANPSLPGSRQGGLFVLLAGYHPSRQPEEWIRLMAEFVEELGQKPPAREELDYARRSAERKLLTVLSDPSRAALYLSRMGGWKPVAALATAWANTTPDDVRRVAAEYLRPERRIVFQPGYVAPAAPGAAQ